MCKFDNIAGKKFGKLLVIERAADKVSLRGTHTTMWRCKCDCGNYVVVKRRSLLSGATKSCGCYNKEKSTKHGVFAKNPRFYNIWRGMIRRCLCKNAENYPRYGGKGITVCERWLKVENFFEDMFESYERHCAVYGSKETTIDRINSKGNYEPSNCKWSTKTEQSNNRKSCIKITINNETKTLKQWCKELNLKYNTVYMRIKKYNFTVEEALNIKERGE